MTRSHYDNAETNALLTHPHTHILGEMVMVMTAFWLGPIAADPAD